MTCGKNSHKLCCGDDVISNIRLQTLLNRKKGLYYVINGLCCWNVSEPPEYNSHKSCCGYYVTGDVVMSGEVQTVVRWG